MLQHLVMGEKIPEQHSFTADIECRYLLKAPECVDERTLLIVALHGYGMNAEVMLRLTAEMAGPDKLIVSMQGPNQFYLSQDSPGGEIGFNWGTRSEWRASVRLHHAMVLHVLQETRGRFGIPAKRSLLAGFSQPVGLNYRFAGTYPGEIGGVVGICGGIPRDWEEGDYRPIPAAVLHIARQEDEFYAPELTVQFPERLRKHATDVEFHLIPGRHRFPSQASGIVTRWFERVFFRAAL
jgi:predicted esterase